MSHNGVTLRRLSSHEVPDSQPFPSDEDRAATSNRWLYNAGLRVQLRGLRTPQPYHHPFKVVLSYIHKVLLSACVFKGNHGGSLITNNSPNIHYPFRNLRNMCQTLL